MLPFLTEQWGNPSSGYALGREAAEQVEAARAKVAALLNADPREVVFTSCGTESINTALHSALAFDAAKHHVLTTAVEHPATLNYCAQLQKRGFEVTYLPVQADGLLAVGSVEKAIRPDTAMVSVMWANNETGVVYPIAEIAALCRAKGVLCHTDAVQVAGKLPIDAQALGVDFLSLSGHKLHAPKGIGMLYVKRHTRFERYVIGGHQERGRRGGTENVAGIVGFGRAAELALGRLGEQSPRLRQLRDRLEDGILGAIPLMARNGAKEPRLPNTANLAFDGIEAEALVLQLDQAGICASSGSACTSGSPAPSHVLTAMGASPNRARGSVRFSLGVYNTDADVDYVLARLPPIVARLRSG
jgi:cysteine desulfurase